MPDKHDVTSYQNVVKVGLQHFFGGETQLDLETFQSCVSLEQHGIRGSILVNIGQFISTSFSFIQKYM